MPPAQSANQQLGLPVEAVQGLAPVAEAVGQAAAVAEAGLAVPGGPMICCRRLWSCRHSVSASEQSTATDSSSLERPANFKMRPPNRAMRK